MKRSAQPFVAAAVLALGVAGVFAILAMRPSAEARPQVTRAPLVEVMSVEPGPCLLYTSPSPRDRQKSRMPSSA